MAEHPTAEGLPIVDLDPETYVKTLESDSPPERTDFSLRIGSLKGSVKGN